MTIGRDHGEPHTDAERVVRRTRQSHPDARTPVRVAPQSHRCGMLTEQQIGTPVGIVVGGGCTALISLTVRAWKSWRSPSPA